ncbi:UNVERIFIED_CONTAM: hypothetical protein K2H54_074026 [Gekko kuhli]
MKYEKKNYSSHTLGDYTKYLADLLPSPLQHLTDLCLLWEMYLTKLLTTNPFAAINLVPPQHASSNSAVAQLAEKEWITEKAQALMNKVKVN